MTLNSIPPVVYKCAIVLATIIWGFSFVVMKDATEALPAAWLLGIRFTAAGIIALLLLWKRVRAAWSAKVLACGAILGALDYAAFLSQTVGLTYTTPGINAFLTALYCVIVPFAWWVLARKKPTAFNLLAAVVAVAGIWFVSVGGTGESIGLGPGELLTILCAVFFAIHIVFVSKFSRFADVLVLTALQFLTEGLLGLVTGVLFEPVPALATFTAELVGSIAFLAVFATIVAFGIQNVSLAYVPPAQAALLLSLESVFGVVFSVLLYGEQLTVQLVVGFALIFVAVLISEVLPNVGAHGAESIQNTGSAQNAELSANTGPSQSSSLNAGQSPRPKFEE